jgi:phosphoribosylaminoimidazolecarboxamide formyltransferase/IMP cyclohydrolase
MSKVRHALISVSDKTGVVEFARTLDELGINIISTGGTGRKLKDAGISVIDIPQVTNYPEMMDGRVKTLHPAVHGGILAVRENEGHMNEIKEEGIKPIDLIVVNLYPFAETIAKEGVKFAEAIENIDIGGPTMIRSAAKNHKDVGVVVDPADYEEILEEIKENDLKLSSEIKLELAYKAFKHTAEYDHLIQNYLSEFKNDNSGFPEVIRDRYEKLSDLRYGENPHQQAAFYRETKTTEPSVATAKQLHGKDLSFNNINDTNGALELIKEFQKKPAAAVIKHANPCGIAQADSLVEAYKAAYAGDPTSAFGSIVALNRQVDLETAQEIAGPEKFVEVVIAPSFSNEALGILQKRWKDVRILETGKLFIDQNTKEKDMKKITGGLLIQDRDLIQLEEDDIEIVSEREPSKQELADMLFSWRVVKHVKSNAIVMGKDEAIVGVGAGQMSRVDAMIIAARKAGDRKEGAVVASDAFFPFKDAIERAAEAGITAIIQPGGSIRDEEVIAAANENNIAMIFTGRRHFRH